ncbi:MAG TPA: bifunctional riboflavin kinase/FAD synthetase [Acidimicrobiales bacterium]|nr:bifunctional riboflavin kinase/FAD synthetase [Acidimicrobiales bacterium]
MIVLRDGESDVEGGAPSVVTIGVFDGLHRGHQAVINQVVTLAREYGARSTVVTFDPSPAMVLAPLKAPRLLATLEQRLEGIETLGVDQVRLVTFDDVLKLETARHFIERVLVGELRTRCVVVGEDFHFGHNREGTVTMLSEVGRELGFDVMPAPLFGDTERWSSTSVRRALAAGDLASAEGVLGHPFVIRGVVGHGDARGEDLGFPTANLVLSPQQALPSEGVYAGATELDGTWWPAAISVGTRPQFYDDGELLVEVHVPGFTGDLYDVALDVMFLERLRDQLTFANVGELTARIEDDVAKTLDIFQKFSIRDAKLLG